MYKNIYKYTYMYFFPDLYFLCLYFSFWYVFLSILSCSFLIYTSISCHASYLYFRCVSLYYLFLLFVYTICLCSYYHTILYYHYITLINYYFIATISYCILLLLHVIIICSYYVTIFMFYFIYYYISCIICSLQCQRHRLNYYENE